MNKSLLGRISWTGETLSGRKIYRYETHPENVMRNKISMLAWWVSTAFGDLQISDSALVDGMQKLQQAFTDPIHLGENTPNSFFYGKNDEKILAVPNPRFDFWEFLGFAISGQDGFEGFARDIGLPREIDYSCVCGIAALILIDSAVTYLDNGDSANAASELFQAREAWDEMLSAKKELRASDEARRAVARAGARKRHAETDQFKAETLAKWETGFFNGNKSAAARWALKQFPLSRNHGEETVRGWIREHEKKKAREID